MQIQTAIRGCCTTKSRWHRGTVCWKAALVLLLGCCLRYGAAQDCTSPTLTFTGRFPTLPEISAKELPGYKLDEHVVSNVQSVRVDSGNDGEVYIDATLADGKLIITINAAFAEFEKNNDKLLFLNTVVFTCTSGVIREMVFLQNIKEENNHRPEFSQSTYRIEIPLPLPREFDIQQFVDAGRGVIANDYDITNNQVTFAIVDNEYFGVSAASGSTRTEFIGQLKTKQTITKIDPPLSLKITATDAGNPPLSSEATVQITGDPLILYIVAPEFQQGLYSQSYKVTESFSPITVRLVVGSYDTTVSYVLSGDDRSYFTVSPSTDRSTAIVALAASVPIPEEKAFLSVVLEASRTGTDARGKSVIVVELLRDPKVAPQFAQQTYTGSIAHDTKAISLGTAIRVDPATSDSTVQVRLVGDDAKYFTSSFSNNAVTVSASSQLTDEVLDQKLFFYLTLEAEKPTVGIGVSFVVLSVTKPDPVITQFERTLYEGTVTEQGTLQLPIVQIAPTSSTDDLTFGYAGDTSFFITSNTGGRISITPNQITEDKLADKSYLLMTITARRQDVDVAQTIVIVRVVRTTLVAPQYESNVLQGQLTERTLQLQIANVEITGSTHSDQTVITLAGNDREFFTVDRYFPDNVYKIFLSASATKDALAGLDRLTLVIEAQNGKSETASCFVLVEIVRPVEPKFDRLIYEGTIDEQNQLIEQPVVRLTTDSYDSTVRYSLYGGDSALFELESLQAGEQRLRLKDPLTDGDLENRKLLQFSVRASKDDASDANVPVVIGITRVIVKVPQFKKPIYKSQIGVDLRLTPFEEIALEDGTYTSDASVTIVEIVSTLFEVKLVEGKITIATTRELTVTDVEGIDRFEFVVRVTNPGQGFGHATVVIDIEQVVDPAFTELYYSGQLVEGERAITMDQTVTLLADTIADGVSYQIEGVDAALVRHSVTADQSLQFYLRDEVTVDALGKRSELSFVVVANNPRSSRATASVSVTIVRPIKATFVQPSFSGKLTEKEMLVNFGNTPIKLVEGTLLEDTAFELHSDQVVSIFNVALVDGKDIEITLKSDIKWEQIRSFNYVKYELTATNPGAEPSQTSVIVDIESLPVATPTFTKAVYRGSLQEGTREVTFAAADVITINAATIQEGFTFSIAENDAELFEVTLVESNKFRVTLKESAIVEGRDLLSFTMTANNAYSATDSATVIVSIKLNDIIDPEFSKYLYSAAIDLRSDELLLAEDILLAAGTFSSLTTVGLGGPHSDLFTVTRQESRVLLQPKDSASWDDLKGMKYLNVLIQANNPGSNTASTFLAIDIREVVQPQFAASTYQGHIRRGSSNVLFEDETEVKLLSDTMLVGLQWNLSGNDDQLFDVTLVDGLFQFLLKDNLLDEELDDRKEFSITVTVENPGSDTTSADIVVRWKEITPVFTKSVYKGSLSRELQLQMAESIEITADTLTSELELTLGESNVDFLTVEQSARQVLVKLARPIDTEDIEHLAGLYATIHASTSDGTSNRCFVMISIPEPDFCTPPSDCPQCNNCTTEGVPDDEPVFEYGNYRFNLRADYLGSVGIVRATVRDPDAILEHYANITDAYLRARLSLTEAGVLQISEQLKPAEYEFHVQAVNAAADKQSTARVLLDVIEERECVDGEPLQSVEKLLVVQHLEEERDHLYIMSALVGNCEYEVLDEKPYSDDPYFVIDSTSHWLTARSFDRENRELFGDMLVPQFQLRLQLTCPSDEASGRSLSKRSLVETESINYARDVTVINVLVDDINDNDPMFEVPSDQTHLGFPEATIAAKLMLSSLTEVHATDADEGLNAKIRYSLSEDEQFMIEPETGLVYPLSNAMQTSDTLTLHIIATDRDGEPDGRSTSIAITVHRLDENHVTVLTLANDQESTVDSILEDISRGQNFQLKVLHQAYIPSDKGTQQRTIVDQHSTVRLVVYAFYNYGNELVDSDIIRAAVNAANPVSDYSVVPYRDTICPDQPMECSQDQSDSDSNVGLIAATATLGTLLLVCMIGAIYLYFRYVRPLKNLQPNPSDIVQLENDFDANPSLSSPALGGKKDSGNLDEIVDRKVSINITGITMQESEDTLQSKLSRSLANRLDEDEDEYGATAAKGALESEPKNVKFNELVERIEVQEHHSDEDDDDNDRYSVQELRM